MKRTRVCDLLGIDYPIIQGGMGWIAGAELAAAVSNAGALGVICPNAGIKPGDDLVENLRRQLTAAQGLTVKPFAVNLALAEPAVKEWVEVVIEVGVKVVITSAGNPATYTRRLKEAGLKVLHVVASVKHARGAEAQGVDGVIAEGYEAGGHNGFDELTTFVLVPQVVGAVEIPVVAAGGIADARGVVAALALGAEGVQMGTRFVATHECLAHPSFKEAIVKAEDTATVITGRKLGPTRGLKGKVTAALLEMEGAGASRQELEAFLGLNRSRKGELEGDLENGELYCGAIAGMITGIMSAEEVVRGIVQGYSSVVAGLS